MAIYVIKPTISSITQSISFVNAHKPKSRTANFNCPRPPQNFFVSKRPFFIRRCLRMYLSEFSLGRKLGGGGGEGYPMVQPFKWNFFSSTFEWSQLFFSILHFYIWFLVLLGVHGLTKHRSKLKMIHSIRVTSKLLPERTGKCIKYQVRNNSIRRFYMIKVP